VLPEPRQLFISPKRLPGRRKAVTIAVGFQCTDCVVLCADREMSKGNSLKFPEGKIFSATLAGSLEAVLTLTYSGDSYAAKSIFDDLVKTIHLELPNRKEVFPMDRFAGFISDHIPRADRRYVELLIGFSLKGTSPCLYVVRDGKVLKGARECIGLGETSLTRYISELTYAMFDKEQSVRLGLYLVSLASRYVSGCGSGMDAGVVTSEAYEPIDTSKYFQFFIDIDKAVKGAIIGNLS